MAMTIITVDEERTNEDSSTPERSGSVSIAVLLITQVDGCSSAFRLDSVRSNGERRQQVFCKISELVSRTDVMDYEAWSGNRARS